MAEQQDQWAIVKTEPLGAKQELTPAQSASGTQDEWSIVKSEPLPGQPNIGSESYMAAHPPTPSYRMNPSYSMLALQNSPSGADPQNPGNPNLNAIPESKRERVNDAALTTQMYSLGGGPFAEAALTSGIKPLVPVAKSIGGAIAGKYLGREVGGLVRHPEIGSTVGEVAGGLYGLVGGKMPTRASLLSLISEAPEEAEMARPGSVPAGKPDPFGGMTSTREPIGNAQLPKVSEPTPQQPLPRLIEKVEASAKGKPITRLPIGPELNSPLTPESVPLAKVRSAAERGDPRAGAELQRRGEQVASVKATVISVCSPATTARRRLQSF